MFLEDALGDCTIVEKNRCLRLRICVPPWDAHLIENFSRIPRAIDGSPNLVVIIPLEALLEGVVAYKPVAIAPEDNRGFSECGRLPKSWTAIQDFICLEVQAVQLACRLDGEGGSVFFDVLTVLVAQLDEHHSRTFWLESLFGFSGFLR